jgi:predicted PurR-regulated permease PerM
MALKKPSIHFGSKSRSKAEGAPKNLGEQGIPLDRAHPFYFGFLAATGAVLAITLLRAFANASQVFVLIIISLFFAAGLNPAVEFFQRRGLKRTEAVACVVGIVLAFVGVFSAVVIPPVVHQLNLLLKDAPTLIANLKNNPTLDSLNVKYGIIDTIQKKVNAGVHDGQFVVGAFGGVIGVGKAVLSGAVATLTILILTLYFLASLPSVTQAAYRFVPLSRRDRVSRISDAIIKRVGAFVSGQASVAVIAGIFALVLSLALGLPYASAISLLVFLCGLIPLIGHILGCAAFTIVALTKSPTDAIIVFVCYVIYIQLENYFILPRIMRRSLSMPGLVTIIAALVGVSLLGVIGGLLAVPIAAAILLIVDEVVFPKAERG